MGRPKLPYEHEATSYLGYPVTITTTGITVNADGTHAAFASMRTARAYVRELRRLEREERAA
jgi:hypothetical protein